MRAKWAYHSLSRLGRTVSLRVMNWKFDGGHHLPESGPAIVAANHVSYLDPPLICSLLNRPIHFMAKTEVFSIPMLGAFLRTIGCFPVRRDENDFGAVRRALRILERGDVLGIFPEGTRNRNDDLRQLRDFYDGVGWLAIRARVPVVPVAIDGYVPWTHDGRWTRPTKLRIACGAPIYFERQQYPTAGRPHRKMATHRVRTAIHSLLSL